MRREQYPIRHDVQQVMSVREHVAYARKFLQDTPFPLSPQDVPSLVASLFGGERRDVSALHRVTCTYEVLDHVRIRQGPKREIRAYDRDLLLALGVLQRIFTSLPANERHLKGASIAPETMRRVVTMARAELGDDPIAGLLHDPQTPQWSNNRSGDAIPAEFSGHDPKKSMPDGVMSKKREASDEDGDQRLGSRLSRRVEKLMLLHGIPPRRSLEGVKRDDALQRERDGLTTECSAGATSEFSDAIRDFAYLLPGEVFESARTHDLPIRRAIAAVATFLEMDVPMTQKFFQEITAPNSTVIEFRAEQRETRSLRFANMEQLFALLAVGQATVWHVKMHPYDYAIPWKTKVVSKARQIAGESAIAKHMHTTVETDDVEPEDIKPNDTGPQEPNAAEGILGRAKFQNLFAMFQEEVPVSNMQVTASTLRKIGLLEREFDELMYLYEVAVLERMPTRHEIKDWTTAQFYGALQIVSICYDENKKVTFAKLLQIAQSIVKAKYGK